MAAPGEGIPPAIDPTDQAGPIVDPADRFAGSFTPELVDELQATMFRVANGARTGAQSLDDLAALDKLAAGVRTETVYVDASSSAAGSDVIPMGERTLFFRTTTGQDGKPREEELNPTVGQALLDYMRQRRPQDNTETGGSTPSGWTAPKPVGTEPPRGTARTGSGRPTNSKKHASPTGSGNPKPSTSGASAPETKTSGDGYDGVRDLLTRRHPGKGKPSLLTREEEGALDALAGCVTKTEKTAPSGAPYAEYTLVEKDASGKKTETVLPKDVGARLYGHNEAGKKASEAAASRSRKRGVAPESPDDAVSSPEAAPKPPRVSLADLLGQYRRGELSAQSKESIAQRLCVNSGEAKRSKIYCENQSDELLRDDRSGLYAIASGIDHPAARRNGGHPPYPRESADAAIGILEELSNILPEPTTYEEAQLQMQEMMQILRDEVPLRTRNDMSDAMVTIGRVIQLEGRRFFMTVQAGTNEVSMYSNGVRRTISKQQGARGSFTHSLARGDASRDEITCDEVLAGDRLLMASDGIIGSNDFRQKPLTFEQYNDIYLGRAVRGGQRPNMSSGATVAEEALRAALDREVRDVAAARRARGDEIIDDMAAIGLTFDTWNTSRDIQAGVEEVFSGQLRGDYVQGSRVAPLTGPERPMTAREKAATAFANSATARLAVGTVLGVPWTLVKPLLPVPNRMDLSWAVNQLAGREKGDDIVVPRWGDLARKRHDERVRAREERAAARRRRRTS